MIIKNLQISNFRNLDKVRIEPHPVLNAIAGDNGAGKTSILEALVVLSRGRSFRTTQAGDLVGPVSKTFQIFAKAQALSSEPVKLGLERSGRRWRGRLNGEDLSQLSQLTRELPLVLIEPDSHLLISGSPDVRRKYLDWGLFHVEHGFLGDWRSYSRVLKQRNAALRRGDPRVLDSLDGLLAEHGERLSTTRAAYAQTIAQALRGMIEELSYNLNGITVTYQKGWSRDTYLESLLAGRSRDLERGQTVSGPHRADLVFHAGAANARAVLSRGEQKMLAVALLLTQVDVLARKENKPLLLLDDLASEFDRDHFDRALSRALRTESQVWLTGTRVPQFETPHKLFHVEQGSVREVV